MDHKLLARVRGLLAKAESTEFEAEAEALTNKAFALMARYGIDEAMVAASGQKKEDIIVKTITIGNPYGLEKSLLLASVAVSAQCRSVVTKSGRDYPFAAVIGFPSDIERVELLYTSLLMQMASQSSRQRPGIYPGAPSVRAFRAAWCAGFTVAVKRRLEEITQRAMTETTAELGVSTELVLIDRSAAVDRVVSDLYPRVRKYGNKKVSASGYARGHAAGERVNLGQTSMRDRRTAIGS